MAVQYIKYPEDFADDKVIINSFHLCTLEKKNQGKHPEG